ncbi:MAG: TIGR00730 family Rossman fold protein [Betaproteobacteria bacterium]
MTLKSVCVFCGSQGGELPEYEQAARELARVLAANDVGLVYGGGHVGLMGALADAMLARGGRVTGVIPHHLMRPEVAHQELTELIVVDSMHERKRVMAARSDAFVVLPGGYGTLEEMFEMVTWRQLRLQAKPVGIVNVEGYFDSLLRFLEHCAEQGFIRRADGDLLIVERAPAPLFEQLQLLAAAIAKSHPAQGDTGRA